jgi:hypothetical protein
MIREEILDEGFIRRVAKVHGLNRSDLATVCLISVENRPWVDVYQVGSSTQAFRLMQEALRGYIEAREEGHTRQYCEAALAEREMATVAEDPDLRAIAAYDWRIPVAWLTREDAGLSTNRNQALTGAADSTTDAGGSAEVNRWARFVFMDGGLHWRLDVDFKDDGAVSGLFFTKTDAIEADPALRETFDAIEKEVKVGMQAKGIRGFGSIHTYWAMKKAALKARGVEWRSPPELNPRIGWD